MTSIGQGASNDPPWSLEELGDWFWPLKETTRKPQASTRRSQRRCMPEHASCEKVVMSQLSKDARPSKQRPTPKFESTASQASTSSGDMASSASEAVSNVLSEAAVASHTTVKVQRHSVHPDSGRGSLKGADAERWLLIERDVGVHDPGCSAIKAFRVDNSRLSATTCGLSYRNSKSLKDKTSCGKFAPWGEVVHGRLHEDGWLQVGLMFLPRIVKNCQVIFQIDDEMSVSTQAQQSSAEQILPTAQAQLMHRSFRNRSEREKLMSHSESNESGRRCSSQLAATSPMAAADVPEWLWPESAHAAKSSSRSTAQACVSDEASNSKRGRSSSLDDDNVVGDIHAPLHAGRLHDNSGTVHASTSLAANSPSAAQQSHPLAPSAMSTENTLAQAVQPSHNAASIAHPAPTVTISYRLVLVELEVDLENPSHMRLTEAPRHLGPRIPGTHSHLSLHSGGSISTISGTGHPTLHTLLLARQPVVHISQPAPSALTFIPTPAPTDATALAIPSDSGAAAAAAPAIAQSRPLQVQNGATTSATAAPDITSFVQQGIVFGAVSAVAMEATQIAVMEQGQQLSVSKHGSQLLAAAGRGASVGAAGAGLAFMFGPVVPTALMIGYGVGREWSDQVVSWQRNEVTMNEAIARCLEVLFAASGGVTAAWATAMLLSGLSAVTVAAAAGCCGFGGNLAGRRLGEFITEVLLPKMSEKDKRLLLAYQELGVRPNCTKRELERAFRKAALARHPDKAGPCIPGSHEKFARLSAAMRRIRIARGFVSKSKRDSMSAPLSIQAR